MMNCFNLAQNSTVSIPRHSQSICRTRFQIRLQRNELSCQQIFAYSVQYVRHTSTPLHLENHFSRLLSATNCKKTHVWGLLHIRPIPILSLAGKKERMEETNILKEEKKRSVAMRRTFLFTLILFFFVSFPPRRSSYDRQAKLSLLYWRACAWWVFGRTQYS